MDKDFQRKGLGTRLVEWGLEELQKGRKKGVEGANLIASPQGEKTYQGAGFERRARQAIRIAGL